MFNIKFSRRTIVIISVTFLTAVLIIILLQPSPVYVDTAKIIKGDLLVSIDEEGKTELKDIYIVSAPVAGRLRRIDIEAGDPVVANDTVLALFEPTDPAMLNVRKRSEAEASVQSAEAAVGLAEAEQTRAVAELDFAESEINRSIPLAEKGTISQSTLDQKKLAVRKAKAQLSQATASLRKNRADLDFARATLITSQQDKNGNPNILNQELIPVRTPISGIVIRVMQESEGVLAAGTPLLELGDPTKLEIVSDLLSEDAVKVQVGDRVIIDGWGGEKPLDGIVRLVEPFGYTKFSALGIEEQRVNVLIDFVSSETEWKNLGHGYRVETRIVTYEGKKVLKAPLSALFRYNENWALFSEIEGRATLKTVQIGQRNSLEAEIVDGLKEGEKVILHPSDKIFDGTAIRNREN